MSAKTKSIEKIAKASDGPARERSSALRKTPAAPQNGLGFVGVQQAAGNLAVQNLFRAGVIQAKLSVSQPGDADEQEADRIAERVVSSASAGVIQRKCAPCAAGTTCPKCEEEEKVQTKEKPGHTPHVNSKAASQITSLRGGGQPLPPSVRAFFEPRFGRDFSDVQVHTDSAAAESARAIGARAFTAEQDVVFGAGEYAPGSGEGQKLLAHELTHVVQHDGGASVRIRRQALPSQPGRPAATHSQQGYRVEVMMADEYFAATGRSLDTLPDRKLVSPDEAGFGEQVNGPLWEAGVGGAMVLPTPPAFPLPQNATGLLWAGGHASDFAVVEGDILARGFRAGLLRHGISNLERGVLGRLLFGRGGGPATASLNLGVRGFWANDWLFPYFVDATAVYPDRQLSSKDAAAFAEFLKSRATQYAGREYRYSPPPPDHPAWQRAFGETTAGFCPLGAANCINLPLEEHQRALGGAPFEPGQPGPKTGQASEMGPWLEEPHPGLRTVQIGPVMRARAAAGVIRAGGMILLVYSGVQSYKRIEEASPQERPIVIGEEAGSWTGGWVGAALSEALGGAFVCAESGPGAFLCALGFGLVGGFSGSIVGHGIGHDVAEGFKLLADTPRLIETTTNVFGSDEDRRKYYELRELETGEPNPWALPE
jgi:hypothetical protein